MFDARSLLDTIVRGAGPGAQQPPSGQGGLGDLLGQLAKSIGQPSAASAGGAGAKPSAGVSSLEDLLRNAAPQSGGTAAAPGAAAAPGGGLGDILGKLQEQLGQASGGAGGGGLMDILGQVLGQATSGVKEGAQRIDQSTGASDRVREMTGKSPEDLLNQLKDLVANNKAGAGAAAGGLGAVILGTRAGRSLAGGALKLGALALIGGLAYKAVQNYQQGKPVLDPGASQQAGLAEAPRGSGFEAGAATHDAAVLYIRGMIAAAAADGRIDAKEQQAIMASLNQADLGPEAQAFLANELKHPATPVELASAVRSPQEAAQLFTAARIAVDPDNAEEHDFLVSLAKALKLDGSLVGYLDAQVRAA